MNEIREQGPVSEHEKIARLAHEIWASEGGKAGRDVEYWLRAQQQLLTAAQPSKDQNGQENNKGTKRKNPAKRTSTNARDHIWA